jgi:hypothetical protein
VIFVWGGGPYYCVHSPQYQENLPCPYSIRLNQFFTNNLPDFFYFSAHDIIWDIIGCGNCGAGNSKVDEWEVGDIKDKCDGTNNKMNSDRTVNGICDWTFGNGKFYGAKCE